MTSKYQRKKGRLKAKICRVEKHGIPLTELFCEKTCNSQCLTAKLEESRILKIRNLHKNNETIPSCYLNYQINKIMNKKMRPYVSDDECLIEMKLSDNGVSANMTGILDTGAQVSCISMSMLQKIFKKETKNLKKSDRRLIGANEHNLNCLGVITLKCTIDEKTHRIRFYVLENSDNIILGLPAIRLFQITINVAGYSVQENNQVRAILDDKSINDRKMPPKAFLATVAHKQNIDKFNTVTIQIVLCGNRNKVQTALYSKAKIYDCLCLIDHGSLCKDCRTTGPFDTRTILEKGTLWVSYKPKLLHDLVPRVDYFQVEIEDERKVRSISAEPPSFSFNEIDGLEYEEGGFILEEGQVLNNQIHPVIKKCDDTLSSIEKGYPEEICGSCKLKNNVFCNLRNQDCQRLIEFQIDAKMEIPEKCVLISKEVLKNIYPNEALMLHIKSYNSSIEHLLKRNKLFVDELHNLGEAQEINLVHLQYDRPIQCFLLIGKVSLLNIELLLSQTAVKCDKSMVKTLHIYDFNALEISREFLSRIFRNYRIKLMLYDKVCLEGATIGKIEQKGREVKATLDEEVHFESQLNVVLKCEETRCKMMNLCKLLNRHEGHLTPLWSKSTHDIGLFIQRQSPFFPIKFRFPIKPEMEKKPPTTIKTAFVSNRLLEPAKQMLDALEKANIIKRGYSKFNARTHFLLKPPKELTIKDWVEKGYGKAEDFVAGTLDKKGVLTVRMVHHFLDLNLRTINSPIYQPSTSEQLRKIAPSIKFLSIIDVTACFFSLMIDEQSSELTGFDVGIQRYQRYKYLRVPMGAGISKTLQDAALLHAISDLGNYIIYSDNIIVLSETKEKHYEHLENILTRLRMHGFKCKLSKASFFITGMVRLYGHILNLSDGTLRPEADKLEALRSKPVPKSRKELKSFLGGLQFFGQLLPLAGSQLAKLHQATRGKVFNWGESQQRAYEEIIGLLSNEGVIFVFRGDDNRPYRVSIDTSEFHTSYIVFQLDDNQDHRPILYGMKTWNDAFANRIPEYRELLGIVHALSALQPEYEHKRHPLIVYTDNLPLCLMNIAARFSRKIARIKLFIESLNWVILHWAPGSSELIALADYFSRQREDTPAKVRQPTESDMDICREISAKIDTSNLYSGPLSSFLIDSLIELPEDDFKTIKNKTATLDCDNRLVFISEKDDSKCTIESANVKIVTRSGLIKEKDNDKTKISPHQATVAHDITNRETKKPVALKNADPEEQILDIVPKKKIKDKGKSSKIRVDNELSKKLGSMLQGKEASIAREELQDIEALTNECEKHSERESIELCDLPKLTTARNSNVIPETHHKKMIGNGSLARWYNNFMSRAKYLDVDKLKEALEIDPYWHKILNFCNTQTKYTVGDKTYFLYGGVLVCKEKINGNTFAYKVCLPGALGYDTVLMAHRQLMHINGKKLVNNLNLHFEIKDLDKLVEHICKECFVCGLNQPQPAGGSRPPLPKRIVLVKRKCSVWFVDELQLVNKETGRELAGYSKLLVAIDGFTHFMVVEPLKEQLTGEIFLKFVQERLHQVFGPCDALITDNDAKISSNLVQAACGYLGIDKLQSLPNSPRGNLAELANKILLNGLRNETMSLYMNPKYFHILLHNVVYLINSLVFTDSKFISPYLLMFAQKPKQEILQIYAPGAEDFLDKNQYLKHLLLVNDVFTKIRLAMIDKRKYQDQVGKNKKYWDSMQPGDIVTIRNPEKYIAKANWKLRPLYKSKFIIVKRTASSAYLRPLENVYLKQFVGRKNNVKIDPDFVYKAEITLLKKVSHMTLLHSNRVKDYYAHFIEHNRVPEPYYMVYDENESSGLLRTWNEVYSDNSDILKELEEAEQIVHKTSAISLIKPCIVDNYRSKMIADITETFKSIQKGQVQCMNESRVKSIKQGKKVSFDPKVCIRSLIKPELIYLCKKPKFVDINNEAPPTLRTIFKDGRTYFCSCKSCKKQLSDCEVKPCQSCYGPFKE